MNWEEKIKEKSYYVDHFSMEDKRHVETKTAVIDLEELFPIIGSLLKQQREICADEYRQDNPDAWTYHTNNKIQNAPEPDL